MKRIVLITFTLIIISSCGCTNETPPIVLEQEPPETVENSGIEEPAQETHVPGGQEELPFSFVLNPDFDRSIGIPIPDLYLDDRQVFAFDLNELTLGYLSKQEWTINEIEEKYGKANEVQGVLEFGDLIEIGVEYEEMEIVFNTTRNGTLSIDTDINPVKTPLPLNSDDKKVKMPIRRVHLNSKESPLPRGLRIGESTLEQVKAAYYPYEGYESIQDEHILAFSYIDFDKLAISPTFPESERVGLNYSFYNSVLVGATLYFKSTS